MKKLFFMAAAMAASMSLMAEIEFVPLPVVGDKNAAGTEFNTSDKVAVEADEVMAQGEFITVKNAYKTTYKCVGLTADSAYESFMFGEVNVDMTVKHPQGQDNPTAAGGNPVLDMKVPDAGACFKVDVKKKGYVYVFVKATPNKQQFVFEQVTKSQSGQLKGDMIEFDYAFMSVKAGAPGDPAGCMRVHYAGNDQGYLQSSPQMPYEAYTTSAYSTNGIGVLMFEVDPEYGPYIVGTAGSKMMAAGFGFSTDIEDVVASSTGKIDGYQDVKLIDRNKEVAYKTLDCSKTPIFLRAKMPVNEYSKEAQALKDSTAFWYYYDTSSSKMTGNMSAWVWETGKDGGFRAMSKSGDYYVLQVTDLTNFNALLVAGARTGTDWSWKNSDAQQTVDINDIQETMCVQVGDVNKTTNAKCTITVLDCLTGDPLTGLEEISAANNQGTHKLIVNGNLYIVRDGIIYDALGAVVE